MKILLYKCHKDFKLFSSLISDVQTEAVTFKWDILDQIEAKVEPTKPLAQKQLVELFPCRISRKILQASSSEELPKISCVHVSAKIVKKRFFFSAALKIHERIHTREIPYQCETCAKIFFVFCSGNLVKKGMWCLIIISVL